VNPVFGSFPEFLGEMRVDGAGPRLPQAYVGVVATVDQL
jgi:hypothetical protein